MKAILKEKTGIIWFAGLFFCFFLISCEEEIQGLYSGEQGVYFSDFRTDLDQDSVSFSFLGKTAPVDTVWLRVRLLGKSHSSPQQVRLAVNEASTTAVSNTHYEPLESAYEFPPHAYETLIPIVLIKHPDLDEQTKVLALSLSESEDLLITYPERASVRIVFSNLIMKPAIWDGTLASLFGVYSRTKHQICMDIMGRPFPETLLEYNLERNMWRNFSYQCNDYFKENIVMDNDLVPPARILPWF